MKAASTHTQVIGLMARFFFAGLGVGSSFRQRQHCVLSSGFHVPQYGQFIDASCRMSGTTERICKGIIESEGHGVKARKKGVHSDVGWHDAATLLARLLLMTTNDAACRTG